MSLTNNKEQDPLLVLDYLQTKLNQANRDVELFTTMIQELTVLRAESRALNTSNNFLHLVANAKDTQ